MNEKIIDERLNGHGLIIVEEAKRAGLDLALACALVEQESNGRNIFGHDHGEHVGDYPPYAGHEVTKERVQALRADGSYRYGMNGIGLTQLTWWSFVEEAEALGGAHIPRNQCRVGFGLLKRYIDGYPYAEALGAYNAGEANRRSVLHTYSAELAAKHERWKQRLAGSEDDEKVNGEHPTIWVIKDEKGWAVDPATGKFIRAKERPNSAFASDPSGWMYPESRTKRVVGPAPRPGNYVDRHPTRFGWRRPVADLARSIEAQYDVYINTYHQHPPGVSPARDFDSFDVWGPSGRGDPISSKVGNAILNRIWYDPNPPYLDWCIFERRIYGAWNNWQGEPFGTDAFSHHDDHLHVTMKR